MIAKQLEMSNLDLEHAAHCLLRVQDTLEPHPRARPP